MLSFLVFGDGCAASIISADETGFAIDQRESGRDRRHPRPYYLARGRTWFRNMMLSGKVPGEIGKALGEGSAAIIGGGAGEIDLWAVHPGGRSILDAVEQGLQLDGDALKASRHVLANFGNMSSATVMFVMQELMRSAAPGQRGCAMSFGPGLTAETMLFPCRMMDFSQRAHTAELMDGPCSYEEFRACLSDLARVNGRTLAYQPTIGFLASLAEARPPLTYSGRWQRLWRYAAPYRTLVCKKRYRCRSNRCRP